MAEKSEALAAEERAREEAPKPSAESERATDKAEREALKRGGGTFVPNEPGIGTLASTEGNPNPRPAGEARPSVDMPTYAPPEQTGPFVGIPADRLDPMAHPQAKKLLVAEQRLAWYVQHQPDGPGQAVTSARAAHSRLHALRHQKDGDAEGVLRTADALCERHGIPELPSAK